MRLWIWGLILSAVAIAANWPRDLGTLKFDLWTAGFPMTYAYGDAGRTVEFRAEALLVNVSIWAFAFAAIAVADRYLRRRSKTRSEPVPESSSAGATSLASSRVERAD